MSLYGRKLRLTTFGESHCSAVGGILEGFPSNFSIDIEKVQLQLDRRRAKGSISTQRQESDKVEILSGLEKNVSLGTPIGFLVKNKDIKPEDYKSSQGEGETYIPRPSHADYTYLSKYNIHASSGGGRSSARETISRVIGGAIAEQYLKEILNCEIIAWVSQIGTVKLDYIPDNITRELVDISPVKCPDSIISDKMIEVIETAKAEKDSVGGIVECVVKNPPIGLGEPCFDKLEALLAHAMLSIPATKGFEIGKGFEVVSMRGSEHNDMFIKDTDNIKPDTNKAGGTLGGISTGQDIYIRIAFKPPSTIAKPQPTVDISGNSVILEAKGRHDPSIVHRAIPIVESMVSLTLLDCYLLNK
jgi:chorismate synthase